MHVLDDAEEEIDAGENQILDIAVTDDAREIPAVNVDAREIHVFWDHKPQEYPDVTQRYIPAYAGMEHSVDKMAMVQSIAVILQAINCRLYSTCKNDAKQVKMVLKKSGR